MKKIVLLIMVALGELSVMAQVPQDPRVSQSTPPQAGMGQDLTSANPGKDGEWTVNVNEMDAQCRERITTTYQQVCMQGRTRGVVGDILKLAGFSGLSSVIDVAVNEVYTLIKYRKVQKQNWMKMIQNECNYTDSITSIKTMKDFYKKPSTNSALDPSDINFDGITVNGVRNGSNMLYISCHIDTTRLDHLFNHSKFFLVVDSISFNPYACHLPNLAANGIREMQNAPQKRKKSSKKHEKAPKETRDNSFSFAERNHLTIGMELSLYSSWINAATFIQQNVHLGTFRMNVTIPDSTQFYTYSRAQIDKNKLMMKSNPALRLDTNYVSIEGDCFAVPRSYMPSLDNERMWGTGEYNIKVKLREACQFSQDATRNDKMKHWYKDYKQLRKMQGKSSEVVEYFKTVWSQNGETIVKTMVNTAVSSVKSKAGITGSSAAGAGASSAGSPAGAGGATGTGTGAAGNQMQGGVNP